MKHEPFNLLEAFDDVRREKKLDFDLILASVREAIFQGLKKKYGHSENVRVELDSKGEKLEVIAQKKVVKKIEDPLGEILLDEAKRYKRRARIGSIVEVPIELSAIGRNAIGLAKQRLVEKLREFERDRIYADYQHRKGEIISGTIQRRQKGDIIVNLGKDNRDNYL